VSTGLSSPCNAPNIKFKKCPKYVWGLARGINNDLKLFVLLGATVGPCGYARLIWFLRKNVVTPLQVLGYPLASYMGYPTEGNLRGFGCNDVSTFKCRWLIFYPSTQMAV
jgi:hypothetical protein